MKGQTRRGVAWLLGSLLGIWLSAGVHAYTVLRGELCQGGLVLLQVTPATQAWLEGEPIPANEQGQLLLGFERDASSTAELRLQEGNGQLVRHTLRIRQRDYVTQRVDGVPQQTVSPPPEVLARIRAENVRIGEAREGREPYPWIFERFQWPLQGPVTGVYGSQRIYNGVPKRPHYGLDIAAPTGSPVLAPAGGIVTLAEPDLYYSGGTLIVDHGYGVTSSFLHLSRLHVTVGQRVNTGDLLAEVGSSGRSSGAHLDWRMNWRGRRVDPQVWMGKAAPDRDGQADSSAQGIIERSES